ncbi:MAG: hypothetical protein JGK17_06325 [Microcoleus sp. PH2017_10_PVI_O_A]|uniref:hypothetical protein n=1 Tax=unclassified Microcoleus TaxID=2642155 RepID=UPI001D6EB378|nr:MULTISPECIES: hypothetical protein [unclassified Microcoleus]TAE84452.1 MAG: hypothetical protein EAZ83_05710 [Oscillatoriales cyanobacterium]MCC3405203.1 hypothetical protein [Microcoleus sp. PH2017_10_PVI_O_A]MCC3459290.1 hypothetical protein [Microcoleus sp. PH2017_11_PCY_U_A]MCC3477395.1 hypothetical protein [Microcoleus sp. PH2017_12_PCY_D_A]MCC3558488.1 hypothetical protein [Microcoleus sp. PH2017_27_LUM_O_A]
MFDKKLKAVIQKYLDARTKLSKSGAKGAITKLINRATPSDLLLIPEIAKEFEGLPQWFKLRFQKGSLYQEGDRVFGWYAENQVQAVKLPVLLDNFTYDDGEEMRTVRYIRVVFENKDMGFFPPISLPFDGVCVNVAVSDDYPFLALWEHGWASPCEIQWSWFGRPRWSHLEGYVVERSIISHGFWCAWKWWPDCWRWYYKKRPELFEDAEWWGKKELVRHEHEPSNPYAAVFSPNNTESLRSRLFYIDND